jgi:hypothetical protein
MTPPAEESPTVGKALRDSDTSSEVRDDSPSADAVDSQPALPGATRSVGCGSQRPEAGTLAFLKPMEIKKLARVPYNTVIRWLTTGHPRAGILPSLDLAETGRRHSYRIRREDWEAFLARLQTVSRERQRARPLPRPGTVRDGERGMFRY